MLRIQTVFPLKILMFFWTINEWIGTGTQQYGSGHFSLDVPTSPGTYYLIFAFNAEYNGSQVASCTNWRYFDQYGSVAWDDGNDLAQLSTDQIAELQSAGRTKVAYHFEEQPQEWTVPADAFTITVVELGLEPGVISGRVIDDLGWPVQGVTVTLDTGESTTTDIGGRYSLTITDESRTVTFSKEGFKVRTLTVVAGSDETVHLGSLIAQNTGPPSYALLSQVPIPLVIIMATALVIIAALRRIR
jgi:hypothetical protein